MQEKLLSVDDFYSKEYDFMQKQLRSNGFTFAESKRGKRLELYVAIMDDDEGMKLFSIIEEVILTSMKWRYYKSSLQPSVTTVDKALYYALLDFDSIGERRFIYENIYPKSTIHIDALYNFSMAEVKSAWDGYVNLVKDFYSNSPDEEEKCELIGYMYAMSGKHRINRRSRLYLSDDEEEILLQKIFFYREKPSEEIESHQNVKKLIKKIFA